MERSHNYNGGPSILTLSCAQFKMVTNFRIYTLQQTARGGRVPLGSTGRPSTFFLFTAPVFEVGRKRAPWLWLIDWGRSVQARWKGKQSLGNSSSTSSKLRSIASRYRIWNRFRMPNKQFPFRIRENQRREEFSDDWKGYLLAYKVVFICVGGINCQLLILWLVSWMSSNGWMDGRKFQGPSADFWLQWDVSLLVGTKPRRCSYSVSRSTVCYIHETHRVHVYPPLDY